MKILSKSQNSLNLKMVRLNLKLMNCTLTLNDLIINICFQKISNKLFCSCKNFLLLFHHDFSFFCLSHLMATLAGYFRLYFISSVNLTYTLLPVAASFSAETCYGIRCSYDRGSCCLQHYTLGCPCYNNCHCVFSRGCPCFYSYIKLLPLLVLLVFIYLFCSIQVRAAASAVKYFRGLPKLPANFSIPPTRSADMFDFLHYTFGFQVGFPMKLFVVPQILWSCIEVFLS